MRKPHVCPKCNGYRMWCIEGELVDAKTPCPTCGGSGVVWDPETDFVQDRPPPSPLPDVEEKKNIVIEDYIPDGKVDPEQRVDQMNAKTDYEAKKDDVY